MLQSIYNVITIKWQYFTIDIDSNRIKLLPHWRLEIQKPQGTNQQRVCNEVPNLTETEACYRCSDIPRYGTKNDCKIFLVYRYNLNLVYNDNTHPIFSFSYNPKYYSTRQLAYELGVGDDNGWIYEDEDDWVTSSL